MADIKDRFTVVETIYHQQHGEQPFMVENRFTRELDTKEQLYQRRIKITEEWKPIDYGWIEAENVGALIVRNEEADFPDTIPNEVELQEAYEKIVEVSYDGSERCMLVLPQESIRIHPSKPKDLKMRCQSGEARLTLFVVPR